MNRFKTLAAAAAAVLPLLASVVPAQDPGASMPERTRGSILKGEVDNLVRAIRQSAGSLGLEGFGSVRDSARALTAMGHCHRFYSAIDGPVVRPAIQRMFDGRRADGAFADAGDDDQGVQHTTAWVAAALSTMDADRYESDITFCREWLNNRGMKTSPWESEVASVLALSERGMWPEMVGQQAAAPMQRGLPMKDGAPDVPAMINALVTLVACQTANRALDQDAAKAPPTFPPAMQRGADFLLTQQENGVFMVNTPAGKFPDPGLTALGLAALQTKPVALRTDREREVIQRGLDWLLQQQNEDGSFGQQTVNYVTCCAVKALVPTQSQPQVRLALDKAQKFILAIQNSEDRGYEHNDRDYGSIGYGGDERGDLSNLQMAVEALRETGLDADHEAFTKAIVFLQRTQNLKSTNDFKGKVKDESGAVVDVVPGNDGGSAYMPGNSPAGYIDLPDGSKIPRSYGSMTYALLKSYTLAGMKKDDPRIQAAVQWIRANWDLDINPGSDPSLGDKAKYQGLFYYYMVLAQALDVMEIDTVEVTVAEGQAPRAVDWRAELAAKLTSLQAGTGSWVNEKNGRWYENFGLVCTGYAMLALDRCQAR